MRTAQVRFALWIAIAWWTAQITPAAAVAGMPAPLPTNWTAHSTPGWANTSSSAGTASSARRWQAISFFLAAFLLSGIVVRTAWNRLAADFPHCPQLSIAAAYRVTTLGGLAFLIVLTMISGARELMTPGAWKKQGWTYQLASPSAPPSRDGRADRRSAVEALRTAAWQHAALGGGGLPTADELGPAGVLPGLPGVHYVTVADRRADAAGTLYAYEPDLVPEPRFALLTNGLIVEMAPAELAAARNASLEKSHAP